MRPRSLYVDDDGRRWRLPKGDAAFDELTGRGLSRIDREVVTERDLFNCHGTFYELPAENAGGFAKIRPITTHNRLIHDYCSYRGLLVMLTGIHGGAGQSACAFAVGRRPGGGVGGRLSTISGSSARRSGVAVPGKTQPCGPDNRRIRT